ncbi:hypothetical protein ES703_118755 [subsurface metagenome]
MLHYWGMEAKMTDLNLVGVVGKTLKDMTKISNGIKNLNKEVVGLREGVSGLRASVKGILYMNIYLAVIITIGFIKFMMV